ncbi:hypothetical protein FOL47_005619 [Perkinsus chesapeaki]|uniref:Uncharacterized protein n=1 Tax=Perkinsus chesapeaki TaxID=330153 RepID=A0A7J6MYG1_PERCH|nr:hypothetical protein FOL47_005619 [Perkinsus chesapeaki]
MLIDSPSPVYYRSDIGVLRLLLLIPLPIVGLIVLFLRAAYMTIRVMTACFYYDTILLYNTADRSVDVSTVMLVPLSLCGLPVVYCWSAGGREGQHMKGPWKEDGYLRICPSVKCQRMYERLVVTYASAIIVDSEPRKEWCDLCYGRRIRDILVAYRPVEGRSHFMNRRSLLEVDRTLGIELGDRPFILGIVNPGKSQEISLMVDGYAHYYHNPSRLLPANKSLGVEVVQAVSSRQQQQQSTAPSSTALISPVSSETISFLESVVYQDDRDASLGSGDSESPSEHEEGSTGCVHSSVMTAFEPVAVGPGLVPPRLILACCDDAPDGCGLPSLRSGQRAQYSSLQEMAGLLENEVTAMCLTADDDVKLLSLSWNSLELDWLCYNATVGLYTPLDTTDPAMLMRLMGGGRPVVSTRGEHDTEGLINLNAGCVVDPPSAQGVGVALVALLHHTSIGILEGMGEMAFDRLERPICIACADILEGVIAIFGIGGFGFSTFSESLDSFMEGKLFKNNRPRDGLQSSAAPQPLPRPSPLTVPLADSNTSTERIATTPNGSPAPTSINATIRLRRWPGGAGGQQASVAPCGN